LPATLAYVQTGLKCTQCYICLNLDNPVYLTTQAGIAVLYQRGLDTTHYKLLIFLYGSSTHTHTLWLRVLGSGICIVDRYYVE
jgi:hypothetical protein